MSTYQAVFGAVVVYILLLLYVGTILYMTLAVVKHGRAAARNPDPTPKLEFPPGLVNIVTVIGGLVSALVVAKLTIKEAEDLFGLMGLLPADASSRAKMVSEILIWAYLAMWLLTGLLAFVVGVLIYPDSSTTLAQIGTTWLGLAVAAAYAYFNIKPKS
jgi:hypothetical protein